MQTRNGNLGLVLATAALSALATGCLERELKPLNPCLVSGVAAEISVTNVDKVDVLFVVDDSQSMAQEQAALREQFPTLVRTLASGMLQNPDGSVKTFPPVGDLHLGVVSTDMGLVGIQGVSSCAGLGKDGILQNTAGIDPALTNCKANYPKFLSFIEERDVPDDVANDFQCIATVGTEGCGFEQQLEAGLKALWPSVDIDPATGAPWMDPTTGMQGNRITFLQDGMGNGAFGHGDTDNNEFLRNNAALGLSLIAVVMVTDEEDCSSSTTRHFTPGQFLPEGDALKEQPINLRCFYNKQNLYSVDRYVNGLRALRPGNENLVVFAGIIGVPPDLVQLRDDQGNALVDIQDDTMREQWYDKILSDVRMTERVDESVADVAKRNLVPSCGGGGDASTSLAYPPRRIVEVARKFGANGIVQSICQNDFSGAMSAIIDIISNQLGAVCLPRQLVPNSDGEVGCDVIWELPAPGAAAPEGTPRTCAQADYLSPPDPSKPQVNPDNQAPLCVVRQLQVPSMIRAQGKNAPGDAEKEAAKNMVQAQGDGWFYDDFSAQVANECPVTQPQRISFTDAAKPPTGVTVKLECLSELQSLPLDYPGLNLARYADTRDIPIIGTPCSDGATPAERDAQCVVEVNAGSKYDEDNMNGKDERMFCHPEQQRCVRRCGNDSECPPAWVCDRRGTIPTAAGEQVSVCVNPTCGD